MICSKKVIQQIRLNEFNPQKLIDQLNFSPQIFPFLKSKEQLLGTLRPIITYCVGISIWAFRQSGQTKREIPDGFFESLWMKLEADKKLIKSIGDFVEKTETNLWEFLLHILKVETFRNKDIKERDLGVGCLILSIVILGLIFAFGSDEDISELNKLFTVGDRDVY